MRGFFAGGTSLTVASLLLDDDGEGALEMYLPIVDAVAPARAFGRTIRSLRSRCVERKAKRK